MIRSAKFVKFLPRCGYEPVVVTPAQGAARLPCDADVGRSPGATIHHTGYRDVVKDVREFFRGGAPSPGRGHVGNDRAARTLPLSRCRRTVRRLAYEAIALPDEHIGWKEPALQAIRALLARTRFDLVYSTSPPESAHLVARAVKREFGIPWVADLRDLWSDDHYRQRSRAGRWVIRQIERRTLTDADALVTVSEPWRRQLAASYETAERPVECVGHGFDAEDYPAASDRGDRFTITYAGTLDADFQDPEPFFAALGQVVRQGAIERDRVRVNFHVFGDNVPDLDRLAERHGLTGIARRCACLEYRACLAAQQDSTALLVFQWRSDAGRGNPPLKVYDYLGARRPMLVVGSGDHVLRPLLEETGAGAIARSPSDIARILTDWYAEYRATGQLRWRGRDDVVARYTRRAQTEKLAAVFDAVIARAALGQ
jgi:glycosyltransferase involved in cell wall biosynthesis